MSLGSPATADVDISSLQAKNPKDLWKKIYELVFPPEVVQSRDWPFFFFPWNAALVHYSIYLYFHEDVCTLFTLLYLFVIYPTVSLQSTSEQKELKDPAKDPQYSEPQIDAMRAQKDQVTLCYSFAARVRNLYTV